MENLFVVARLVQSNEEIAVPLQNIDGFRLKDAFNLSFSRNKIYNVFTENEFIEAKLQKIFGKISSIHKYTHKQNITMKYSFQNHYVKLRRT